MGCACVKINNNKVEPVADDFNQPVAPGGLAEMATEFCKNTNGIRLPPMFDMPTGYLGPQKKNMIFASQKDMKEHTCMIPTTESNGIFPLSVVSSNNSNGLFPIAPVTSSGSGIGAITSMKNDGLPFSSPRAGMIPLSPSNNGLLPLPDSMDRKLNDLLQNPPTNIADIATPRKDNTPREQRIRVQRLDEESSPSSADLFQQPQIPQVFVSMPPSKEERAQKMDHVKLEPMKHVRPLSARGDRLDVRPSDRIKFDPDGLLTSRATGGLLNQPAWFVRPTKWDQKQVDTKNEGGTHQHKKDPQSDLAADIVVLKDQTTWTVLKERMKSIKTKFLSTESKKRPVEKKLGMDNVLKAFRQPEAFADDGYDDSPLFIRRNDAVEMESVSSAEDIRVGNEMRPNWVATQQPKEPSSQNVNNPLMFSWISALPGAIPDFEEEQALHTKPVPRFTHVNRL